MNKYLITCICLILAGLCFGQAIPEDSLYLAQAPPGTTPVEFQLPVSGGTFAGERIAITIDGKEIFYGELNGWPSNVRRIKSFTYNDGAWQGPTAVFEGFVAPALSINDSIVFMQNDTIGAATTFYSIRNGTGWTVPSRLLSTSLATHYYQETQLGNHYLASAPAGNMDICKRVINSTDTTIQSLGKPINTSETENDFFIARDESYIIFFRLVSPYDLFISYHNGNGTWTNPKSLGTRINSSIYECCPFVTNDNKYLFLMRGLSGYSNYWVRVDSLIDSLRHTNFIPYVKTDMPDQIDTSGQYFSFAYSDSTFIDDDGNNSLTYTATLGDGSPLPAWLSFNPSTRTFSGTPPATDTLVVKVTATDTAFASVSDTFNLAIVYATHSASLSTPNGGEVVSGTYTIAWNTAAPGCTTDVSVSRDQGLTWTAVAAGQSGSGQFSWNTAGSPDGVRYRARIFSHSTISIGWDESDGDFTVDNPGNAAPELNSPAADSAITGSYLWPWWSGDADGDQLLATLAVRRFGQSGWTTVVDTIATGAANTRIWRQYGYTWSTDSMIDDRYQFKVSVFDGSVVTADSTTAFSAITNSHSHYDAGNVSGASAIPFSWYVIHPERLTGHTYEARFKPIVRNNYTLSASYYPAEYRYDLWDITTSTLVWADRELPSSLSAGVCSYYDPGAEFMGCVPTCGSAAFAPGLAVMDSIKRPASDPSVDTLKGFRITSPNLGWACLNTTMEIRWHVSGTAPNDTVRAEVWDMTYDTLIPYDSTILNNQTVPSWNLGGLTTGLGKRYMTSASSLQRKFMNLAGYRLYFNNNAGSGTGRDMTWSTHPQEGDVWRVYYAGAIPPRNGDVFSFTPTGVAGGPIQTDPGAGKLYQNTPNPFGTSTAIRYQLQKAEHVRLTVYNVLGQAIRTLVNGRQNPGFQSVAWDCRTERNEIAANGIYFYTLSIGGMQASKKMIVLR